MIERRYRRTAFWIYAAVLFTLTHWPRFAIVAPIARPDLIAHAIAFGMWTILFTSSSFFGPARSKRNILRSTIIAALYACVDEALQAIPFLHRHVSWDDLLANFLGVALGAAIMLASTAITRRPVSE